MSEKKTGWWMVKTKWGDTFPAHCGNDGRLDVPTFYYDCPMTVEDCELEFLFALPERLMLAAPELLAALNDLMDLYGIGQLVIEGEPDDGFDPVVDAAFKAIDKAEGRGE
jgi:hypothetical protein